jgi:isopentenyl-diphosphate delta-isomerase
MAKQVILCDERGQPHGSADMVAAHTGAGQLHLAFSVYVFSPDRSLLLIQQRSRHKMLWPLVWANTCCSHPRQGETAIEAGERRLREEMGITCALNHGPEFVYRAVDPAGRGVEYEYDVILFGNFAGEVSPDPDEVAACKWIELERLQHDMRAEPEKFAPWLHLGLPKVIST